MQVPKIPKIRLPKNKWAMGALALIFLLLIWMLFFRGGGNDLQTLVVQRADFVQQVAVSGTVKAGKDVDLGFAEGGRISGTYVSVGANVRAGTVIAEVENGDRRAAVSQREAALAVAQANLDSLKAGTRQEQLDVTRSQVESDKVSLAQANQALLNAIQDAYTEADDAIHNKVDQFFSNPRSTTPQLSFSTSNSQLSATLINDRIAAEGMLSAWSAQIALLTSTSDLAKASAQADANLSSVVLLLSHANAALNTAIPSGSVTQTTIDTYVASVGTARASVNASVTSLTTAKTAQLAAKATLDKDSKNLALEEAGSTSQDIEAQEAQVASARADLEAARSQLRKTLVVAPFDGIVTKMDAKVGEIVSPNTSQISMISTGVFQIETFVPEVSIAQVEVGDQATTTLDAYGAGISFLATVVSIDPAETEVGGISTYKTMLQFSQPDSRIRSGMTASVMITTERIPQTIAIPQGAIYKKDDKSFVEVKVGGKAVEREIGLGATSQIGNVQVLTGLSEGDILVLNPSAKK